MTDQETVAAEEFLAANVPETAKTELVEAARRAVTKWAATRTTSIPRTAARTRTQIASPKDVAFKALSGLVEQLATQKPESELLASARRLLPFLKRSSGAHIVSAKKPRPTGAGR